jgi:hypothetical protein
VRRQDVRKVLILFLFFLAPFTNTDSKEWKDNHGETVRFLANSPESGSDDCRKKSVEKKKECIQKEKRSVVDCAWDYNKRNAECDGTPTDDDTLCKRLADGIAAKEAEIAANCSPPKPENKELCSALALGADVQRQTYNEKCRGGKSP